MSAPGMDRQPFISPEHEQVLDQAIAGAAFLHERLDTDRFTPVHAGSDEIGVRLLQSIYDEFSQDENVGIDAWLDQTGYAVDDVKRVAGGVRLRHGVPRPEWVRFFQHASELAMVPSRPFAGRAIAFDQILLPFVDAALGRVSLLQDVLMPDAIESVRRSWCSECSALASRVLHIACTVDRVSSFTVIDPAPESDAHYQSFTDSLRRDGLVEVLRRWPVLTRRLATMLILRADALAAFLERRQSDAMLLDSTFGDSAGSGKVNGIEVGLSDAHAGGQSVISFVTSNGVRMIYKPRPIAIECAYQGIVSLLRSRYAEFDQRTILSVDRGQYGWVEFIRHQPCRSIESVHRFYKLAGMQLALVHALNGEDYHFDNLIACDDQPLLIDHECLCGGRGHRRDACRSAAHAAYDELHTSSVLATSLVPRWVGAPSGRRIDVSGLGNHARQHTDSIIHEWLDVNTDRMSLSTSPATYRSSANIVELDGVRIEPARYKDDLVAGFRVMYDWLLADRDTLLVQHADIMEAPNNATIRDVRRTTEEYVGLIRALGSPRLQECGLQASLLLSQLHDKDEPEASWREQQELLAGDIPYFVCTPKSSVADLLQRLSEEDRDRQCAILTTAFQLIDAPSHGIDRIIEIEPDAAASPIESSREQAVRIAQLIESMAVMHRNPDGWSSAAWIAPTLHVESDTWGLDTLPVGLMHGQGGVALFLASVSGIDDTARWSALSRSALGRIVHDSDAGRSRAGQNEWLGALEGAPSAAAALLLVGERIGDMSLCDAGWSLLEQTTSGQLRAARANDIVLGLGGFLQVASTFASRRRPRWLREAAAVAVDELVQRAEQTSIGGMAWRAPDGTWMTGMSHGSAGIVQSMLIGARAFDFQAPLDLIRAAREFEDRMRDPHTGLWKYSLNPKTGVVEEPWCTWCHGAPGMSLSYLAEFALTGSQHAERAALEASQINVDTGKCDVSSVCCGQMGRAICLAEAGKAMNRPEWVSMAEEWIQTAAIVNSEPLPNPTLFKGMAGIGSGLLLADSAMRSNPIPWFSIDQVEL